MISGETKTVSVIAEPVFQLQTPQELNAVWARRGADVVTHAAEVAGDGLERYLDGMRTVRNWAGAVVSIPHKQAAAALCDRIGANAAIVGAVNTIRRESDGSLVGETLDGLGFVAGLDAAGIDPSGMQVVVLGAGGAAAATAAALIHSGIDDLLIINRTVARAIALRDRLIEKTGFAGIRVADPDLGHADLIINATSNGMRPGDTLHVDLTEAKPSAVVAEVVVSDSLTPLLAAASRQGLTVHEGRAMLTGQVELIADFLTP